MKRRFFVRIVSLAFAATFFSLPAFASWVRRFGISDQEYRITITSTDIRNTTSGFFLTSFPCYAKNASEHFRTTPGRNNITLYCLEPPREIYLSYLIRPNGAFVSRNERMDGYMRCPVRISGPSSGGVIPRLSIVVQECDKREINPQGNRQILRMGVSGAGQTIEEAMAPESE